MSKTDSKTQNSMTGFFAAMATTGILFLAIVVVIVLFISSNNKKIYQQNRIYLEETGKQKSLLLRSSLDERIGWVDDTASLYGEFLKDSKIDLPLLKLLEDNTSFNHLRYFNTAGIEYTTDGKLADCFDRPYFKEGIAGKKGFSLIEKSRTTGKRLIVHYAPVYKNSEIIGIMGGFTDQKSIEEILDTTLYGEKAQVFLCTKDAVIIASTDSSSSSWKDVFQMLRDSPEYVVDRSAYNTIRDAFTYQDAVSFDYKDVNGLKSVGYTIPVNSNGWMLIEIFPASLAQKLIEKESGTIRIIIVLIEVFFGSYLLSVVVLVYVQLSRVKQIKEDEVRIKEALKKAESANDSKTRFLLNLSHDIRTPMNALLGFTKLLEKDINNTDKLKSHIQNITDSGNLLSDIISKILDMASIENKETQINDDEMWSIFDFSRSIDIVFSDELHKKSLFYTSSINVIHDTVFIDSLKLRQVFHNVLSNAIKYTPEGGKITCRIDEIECPKKDYALIRTTITDTGVGMSKEFLPHVFDNFSREKDTTESKIAGTGLGMGIAKSIVDLMGGTIEISSTAGKGTSVVVTVPHRIASEQQKSETIRDKQISEPRPNKYKGKRILIAEDNELNAQIACELFREYGFEVEVAEDGVKCVHMVNASLPSYYDLIFMDIMMPNMDGYKATELIRNLDEKSKKDVPVIAMTANSLDENRKKAKEAGMNDFIEKPISVQHINEVLDKYIKV